MTYLEADPRRVREQAIRDELRETGRLGDPPPDLFEEWNRLMVDLHVRPLVCEHHEVPEPISREDEYQAVAAGGPIFFTGHRDCAREAASRRVVVDRAALEAVMAHVLTDDVREAYDQLRAALDLPLP